MALTERYTIDQKLGEGGFGAVFRGTHRQMSTPVAIKVLHAQHASSSETVARFEQEARRSAALKHPNTIRVFDFGRDDDGSLYLVMELLDGAPLSHHIKQGRFAADRVVHIVAQALAALDEAHQQGLVHRDLKPDNIFLTRLGKDPDFVKVLDFGIAKALDTNAKLTASGVVIGTPTYMSPEQCRGAALDPRSDLYSLGCIAYEMLAGRPPFLSDTIVGYIFAHVQQAPDLTKLAPNVPEGLVAWVGRCLEKDPADRFASADEAREALLAKPPHAPSSSFGAVRPPTYPSLPDHPTHTQVALDTARSDVPPRGPGKWLALGGGLVAVGLLVWGIVEITSATSYIDSLPEPPKVTAHVEPAPLPVQPVAIADTTPSTPPPTEADTAIGAVPSEPDVTVAPKPPDEASAPTTQRVALSSVPTGATVKRDGQVLGQTPLELTWLVGETTPFKVELKNHDTATLRPTALTGKTIHEVRLTRTAPNEPGGAALGTLPAAPVPEVARSSSRSPSPSNEAVPSVVASNEARSTTELNEDTVQQYIRRYLGGVKWCYQDRLQSDPRLAGKATLEFKILADGSVLEPRLANSTIRDSALESCIIRKMRSWRFPAPKDGGVVEVAYPLVLKTQ